MDRQLLTALAMVMARADTSVTLVLDGYEMASRDVANDLDYLLRHSGRRLHIVIVTRVDPILPLYRYRLEDRLTEIRMVDLAFTDAEVEELMRNAGLALTAASVHTLNQRTHGWVAGLRFASRFLGKSGDPDVAVAQVSGDSGDIGEYLMGEVLAAQTPENRRLLLSTSIPAVIQPGLAEALGGRAAPRMLSFLARVNAFVEPVPDHPGFYRYHPFFRDLLRAELAYEAPEEMDRLQRVAAEWFAQEGLVAASVGHYAEIGAWADAAGTVVDELAFAQLLTGGADDTLAKALMPIPDELGDPAASVVRAALAMGQGDSERVTTELAQVSPAAPSAGDGQGGALSLAVAVLQSIHARGSDDAHKAFELAEEAEEALTDGRRQTRADAQHELSALVSASKGIAALRRGRLSDAHELFTDGSESALSLGSEPLLVECQGYLALIACLRDQLSEAVSPSPTEPSRLPTVWESASRPVGRSTGRTGLGGHGALRPDRGGQAREAGGHVRRLPGRSGTRRDAGPDPIPHSGRTWRPGRCDLHRGEDDRGHRRRERVARGAVAARGPASAGGEGRRGGCRLGRRESSRRSSRPRWR